MPNPPRLKHGAGREADLAGRRMEEELEKGDVFRRIPSVFEVVQSGPRFAPRGSRTCGLLGISAVGGNESRSQGGRLAERHEEASPSSTT